MNSFDMLPFYQQLRINPKQLGCVMLELEQLPVKDWVGDIPGYYPTDTEMDWIKGFDVTSHMTVLYGLLMTAWNRWPYGYREGVDMALEGWAVPQQVRIEDVDVFPSPLPDTEPYKCIIGRVEVTPELLEGHQRLSLLPHINTYLEYKPHVTLGYVHQDVYLDALELIELNLAVKYRNGVRVTGISLGDRVL